MRLNPRYDGTPVVAVEVRRPGPHPVLTQRQRLGDALAKLTEAQWHEPSRCDGWTVQDVVSHLTSTNGFWALSIAAGVGGAPTRFLATFDPVATPAALADAERGSAVADTLSAFLASNAALAAIVDELDGDGWATLAEAPPGHLPVALVADHALWDAWVHERDVLLPLGLEPVVEPGEVQTCLRYAVALGRAFALCQGSDEQGAMAVRVSDPDDAIVVEVVGDAVRVHADAAPAGTPELTGDAVTLLEMVSARDVGVPRQPALGWLLSGLEQAFDQAPER